MSLIGDSNENPHLYVIEVKGSIVSEEGNQYAQGWTAGDIADINDSSWVKEHFDVITHSFDSDLRLNKKRRAVPYAYYVAYGSIGVKEGLSKYADLTCIHGYPPAFIYLDEYLKEVEDYLSVTIPSQAKDIFYNGLYVTAFGILELFLCDFLLCGILSNGENFNRAASLLCKSSSVPARGIENIIRKTITGKVFHKFEEINKLFRSVLDIELPNTDGLKRLIHRRHNIVHRYAISNIDRMTVCDATEDDVSCLIHEIRAFSSDLWKYVSQLENPL